MGFSNDFGFSFSQWKLFTSCSRRWYLEKIRSWQGWNSSAPAEARHAYRLKQMQGVFGLAGSVVHDIARQVVVDGIDRQTAEARYDSRMRLAWRQARHEAGLLFTDRAKHKVNLFELFYSGHDIDVDRFSRIAFERGLEAVGGIFESTPYRHLQDGAELIEAEELRKIHVGFRSDAAVPTWVKVDLVYRYDGAVYLWDWKTGKPGQGDHEQLLLYGVYGIEAKYAKRPDDLRLGLCYVRTDAEEIFTPSADALARTIDRVVRSATQIRAKLPDPAINQAPMHGFPRTRDLAICKTCEQFFACKGHRDVGAPERIAAGFE